ncbi:MAG: RluA family pseudouridine synthase [Rhizomicrobium sp.]|jgi:23S rRNA pseudouridine955/2504/2580 synthase
MSVEAIMVERDDDGIRVDRWFKRHYPAIGHGLLEKLLRTGQVRVDGKRAKSGDRISAGQILRLPPQVQTTHSQQSPSSTGNTRSSPQHGGKISRNVEEFVIHMDSSVLVLNKPSGLATQGGSGIKEHVDGLLDQLMFGRKQRPKLVHRLDRDTSGVLVVARTAPAAAALSESLRQRDAQKIYWALTRGAPKPSRGTIKSSLAKELQGRDEKMAAVDGDVEGAKNAMTDYAVMGHAGQEYAWVAAKPVTGRMHQIRVHLASLGTPIVGDFKYGGTEARGRGQIENKLHLHARSIDIAHPDGGRLCTTAPLPEHMLRTWSLLGFDPNATDSPFKTRRRK